MSPDNSSPNKNQNTAPNSPSSQLDRNERFWREFKMVAGFAPFFANKLDQIINSEFTFKREDLEPTIKMLNNVVRHSGLWQGSIAGLVTSLVVLRRSNRAIRRLQQQHQSHSLGRTNEIHVQNSPFGITPPPPSPWPPYSRRFPISETREILFLTRILGGMMLEALLCYTVTISTWLWFRDPLKMRQSLAPLVRQPLVPGRSRVADEFCSDVVAEWKRLAVESGMSEELQQQPPPQLNSIILTTILEFKDNCLRRQALERRLRRERGLAADFPVAIPASGVPVDDPTLVLESDDYDVLLHQPDTSSSCSRNHEDDDWADSLTTDREDDDRRRR